MELCNCCKQAGEHSGCQSPLPENPDVNSVLSHVREEGDGSVIFWAAMFWLFLFLMQ